MRYRLKRATPKVTADLETTMKKKANQNFNKVKPDKITISSSSKKTKPTSMLKAIEFPNIDNDSSRVEESKELMMTQRLEANKSQVSFQDPSSFNDRFSIHNIHPVSDSESDVFQPDATTIKVRKVKPTIKESVVQNTFASIANSPENEYSDTYNLRVKSRLDRGNKTVRSIEPVQNKPADFNRRMLLSENKLRWNNFMGSINSKSSPFGSLFSHKGIHSRSRANHTANVTHSKINAQKKGRSRSKPTTRTLEF